MISKKKIIIYSINDPYFTLPTLNKIFNHFSKSYDVDIYFGKVLLRKKIKALLWLVLNGSLFDLIKLYLNKKKYTKLLNKKTLDKRKSSYEFGISFNYQQKLKEKHKIYNFHLGDFKNQRGVFIFFYKFKYNWKTINLTFHKINAKFDDGKILNKKVINIQNKNSMDIIQLYSKNLKFIIKSLNMIKKKKITGKYSKSKNYNKEPSFLEIILKGLNLN